MSNRSKDNIEDLFRRIFNKEKKGRKKSGWDVPPSDVWEEIEQTLVKNKTPERSFLYWKWLGVAASFLLLLSLYQLYLSNLKFQLLSNQLEKNEQSLRNIQQEVREFKIGQAGKQNKLENSNKEDDLTGNLTIQEPEIQAKKILNNPASSQPEKVVHTTTPKNIDHYSASITSTPLNTKETTNSFGQSTAFNNTIITAPSNKHLSIPLPNQEQFLTTPEQPIPLVVSPLAFYPSVISMNATEKESFNIVSPTIQPVVNKKPSFFVATMFAPMWSKKKAKGDTKKSNILPKKETQVSAYSTGLNIGMTLPDNWTIESGLHVTSINKQVRHIRNFPYFDLEERLTDNGKLESDLNFQLRSSSGTVETNLSLSRSANTSVADETQMNVDIVHTHAKKFLDVPLILRKQVRVRNWEWSIRGGVLHRFRLSRTINFQQVSIDDNRFKVKVKAPKNASRPKEVFSMHYLVGLGLAYHLSPNVSFYADPTISRSIQPAATANDYRIHSQFSRLNLGVRWRIN